MSGLALTNDESELLRALGWQVRKTSDGSEFFMDLGQRQVKMGPVLMRKLKPMSFRSQAQRYDKEYDKISREIGWGGHKSFGAGQKSLAMSTFKIEKFDAEFAKELTEILKDYALNEDPEQLVAERIERRKKVRWSLSKADFIDYAYLRRTEDLENISLEERDDGTEFISPKEDVECLRKAIEVSKRP